MNFEQFSQGNSLMHRRDARAKVLSAAGLVMVLALCQHYATALAGLLLGLALVCTARLNLRRVVWRLAVVNTFIVFLWFTVPLTYPGASLFAFGPFSLSKAGISLTGLITIKANAIVLLIIALLATSTIADLGHALDRLQLPTKLCLLLLFSYRYIFVINQEYQRLARAVKIRCFQPRTNLHTYRTYGYLVGMTLLKSYRRADRVRQAMLLRGFQGTFQPLNRSVIDRTDLMLLAASLLLSALLATFELLC